MINVALQPEPEDFDELVRKPGLKFLASRSNPNTPPTNKEYKPNSYWTNTLKELHTSYSYTCAYCCELIHTITGNKHVDHFHPKSQQPFNLAYEWDNYRLSSGQLNTWKGTHRILDPFEIEDGWFTMIFPSLQVIPAKSSDLPSTITPEEIQNTIDILKLNHPLFAPVRKGHLNLYCRNNDFDHLLVTAPFIAKELVRQGLVEKIKEIWLS